jgi:ornithine decarboxylase
MAQIEVFHQSAIDFDNSYKFACGPIDQFPTTLTHISGLASISPPKSNGLAPVSVHSILVSEEETHGNDTTPDPDVAIPGLPPVLSGHPEVILRQLIARSLSNEDESNEEKAFFVADLSQVLKQHQRFVKCLPGIEPFYGMSSISSHDVHHHH